MEITKKSLGSWPADGVEEVMACPICGSKKRSLLYEELTDKIFFCAPGEWKLYRCDSCESGYLNPRPTPETIGMAYTNYFTHHSEEVDEMSGFRKLRRALANGYHNKKYGTNKSPSNIFGYWLAMLLPSQRAFLDAAMRHLPHPQPGNRLLDVGCGSGDFLMHAMDAGWEVIGVDPDPKAVEMTHSRSLDVRYGGIDAVSDMQESFDGITLSHVIEHVHDPLSLLNECYRLIKPGGWIWIETPNINALGHCHFKNNWRGLEPPRHLVIFNHTSLKKSLINIGFCDIKDMPHRNIYTSLYSANLAIRQGCTDIDNRLTLVQRVRCLLPNLYEKQNPEIREFITIKCHKPNI